MQNILLLDHPGAADIFSTISRCGQKHPSCSIIGGTARKLLYTHLAKTNECLKQSMAYKYEMSHNTDIDLKYWYRFKYN